MAQIRVITPAGALEWREDPLPQLSIQSPVTGPVTQAFAVRSVTGILHRGIDQSVSGVEVLPVDVGGVWQVRTGSWSHYGPLQPGYWGVDTSNGGYGNFVVLRHTWGFSMYAHLRTVAVEAQQIVQRDTALGISNSTGISTGDHLHWECRLPDNATRFDPAPYIEREVDELAFMTDAEKARLKAWLAYEPVPGSGVYLSEHPEQVPLLSAEQKAELVRVLEADVNGGYEGLRHDLETTDEIVAKHRKRLEYQARVNALQDRRIRALAERLTMQPDPDLAALLPEPEL